MLRGGSRGASRPTEEMRANEQVCEERTETIEGGLNEVERLCALEVNNALAYGNAAGAVASGPTRDKLRRFELEHQRHAVALLEAEIRLGHLAPEAEPDVDAPTPPGLASEWAFTRQGYLRRLPGGCC